MFTFFHTSFLFQLTVARAAATTTTAFVSTALIATTTPKASTTAAAVASTTGSPIYTNCATIQILQYGK